MKRLLLLLWFLWGFLGVALSSYLPSWAVGNHSIAPSYLENRLSIAKTPEKKDKEKGKEEEKKTGMPFAEAIKDRTMEKGLFTLYTEKKTGNVLIGIQSNQLNRNFLMTITLASGLGENGIYSGFPLDDYIFQWRKVKDSLQLAIPNVRVRGRSGEPSQRSVQRSFSDSIVESLPIVSMEEKQGIFLVDLSALLKKDIPNLTPILSSVLGENYSLSSGQTFLDRAQAFPENIEVQSVLGFESTGARMELSALPDGRAFNLRIHYSLSELPKQSSYRPRIADARIGYFVTAYRDFGDSSAADPYIRYINRWHLEKKDKTLPLSPPKEPIVFWIENAVPKEYRNAVREGVLLWNEAFAQIGFQDAIEVKQMPDNATWDPADVRYSTVRWMNSLDAVFALGPSRVNPLTGQILDADILIDGNFIRSLGQDYEVFASENQQKNFALLSKLTGSSQLCSRSFIDRPEVFSQTFWMELLPPKNAPVFSPHLHELCYGMGAAQQLGIGALSLALQQNILPSSGEMQRFLQQFIRQLVAHEVGHTLGLRHNFHGSALLSPQELHDRDLTQKRGLSASVMDYNPVNLAPPGTTQGEYFTQVLGEYDRWAIAYGYTPMESVNEHAALEKIARRAPEPSLAYATDEDRISGLDPLVNAFDLSNDLLTFTQGQMDNARALWQKIGVRYPGRGQEFSKVRNAFNQVLSYYFQNATLLPNFIGGQSFNRYRSGDDPNKLPFTLVPKEQQKQALEIIDRYIFRDQAWQFSPELLNKLAPSRWFHWNATPRTAQIDYPIHEQVALLQGAILSDLLSSQRLHRIRNNELKSPPGQSLTLPELFDSLHHSIWREVLEDRQPVISSWRRTLQRLYLNTLVNLTLRSRTTFAQARSLPEVLLAGSIQSAPEDARVLARSQLVQLQKALQNFRPPQDAYTRSHLEDSLDRITKTLAAGLNAE